MHSEQLCGAIQGHVEEASQHVLVHDEALPMVGGVQVEADRASQYDFRCRFQALLGVDHQAGTMRKDALYWHACDLAPARPGFIEGKLKKNQIWIYIFFLN